MKKRIIIITTLLVFLLGIGLFFLIYNSNHTTLKSFDNSSSITLNTGNVSYNGDNGYKVFEKPPVVYDYFKDMKKYKISDGNLFIDSGRLYSLTWSGENNGASNNSTNWRGDVYVSSPYYSFEDKYNVVGIGYVTLMEEYLDSDGNYVFKKVSTDFETKEEYDNYYSDYNRPSLTRFVYYMEYVDVIDILDNLDSKYVTKIDDTLYLNVLDNDGNLTDYKLEVGLIEVENKKYAYFDIKNYFPTVITMHMGTKSTHGFYHYHF